jgi:hypothetical protein
MTPSRRIEILAFWHAPKQVRGRMPLVAIWEEATEFHFHEPFSKDGASYARSLGVLLVGD